MASCAPPTGCSSAPSSASPRRARSCPTCATSASRTCTCRRRCRPARARRTATTSSTRRGSPRRSAARRRCARCARRARPAWGSCSTSCPTTWPPTRRTAAGPTPSGARRFFDHDPDDGRHRRFFDIDDLAARAPGGPGGLRARRTPRCSRWCATAWSTGCASTTPTGSPTRPATCGACARPACEHVWVEKILHPGEPLRDWPVEGTVGYEFLNDAAALFVDPAGEAPLTALWAAVSGDARPFAEVALEAQLEQATTTFAPEVERLRARRHARRARARALARAVPGLPHLRRAVVGARRATPTARRSPRRGCRESPRPRAAARGARLRTSSSRASSRRSPPVMAKGVEDTAFYRYLRLLALNEVGGDPARFGLSRRRASTPPTPRARRASRAACSSPRPTTPSARATCARGSARWPAMPTAWAARVQRWFDACAPLGGPTARPTASSSTSSSRRWSARGRSRAERLEAYLEKALREAKRDDELGRARRGLRGAREGVLPRAARPPRRSSTTSSLRGRASRAAGERAALGQLLLKLTVPGVPDVYQGDELSTLSLVDPDNRRPGRLGAARRGCSPRSAAAPPRASETRKLELIQRALALRARRARARSTGAYEPLDAGRDVCAFLRGRARCSSAAVRRGDGTGSTLDLPEGRWRDVLGGGERRARRPGAASAS